MHCHPKALSIQDFTYLLPEHRIAYHPLPERDAARLLVYRDGRMEDSIFRHLPEHLPAQSLLVFNETKVVQARLLFHKATGGAIELLCLAPHARYTSMQEAMTQKGEVFWQCMIGGKAKWKNQESLTCKGKGFTLTAHLENTKQDVVHFTWDDSALTFGEVLQQAGQVPLPPYLKRAPKAQDEARYQTVFAKQEGSVAAPTASLHFTPALLKKITQQGIATTHTTLHVGAGTFAPVKSDTLQGHTMHEEWIEVGAATLKALLAQEGKPIVATGTTTLRTLESLYWIGNALHRGEAVDWQGVAVAQWQPYEARATATTEQALQALLDHMHHTGKTVLRTRTQVLLAPGYTFKIVNGLITNFHQPGSTLLLLVAAFIGDAWKQVYQHALQKDYRFLSYGDGSLLWRACL